MKKINTLLAGLLISILSVNAQLIVQWESDLSNVLTNNNLLDSDVLDITEFPAGEIILLTQPSYTNIGIIILDNEGSLLAQGGIETSEHIYDEISVAANVSIKNFIIRYSEWSHNNFLLCSVSNSTIISEYIGKEAPDYPGYDAPYRAGIFEMGHVFNDPATFYDYSHTNSVLRKYRLGSTQTSLAGGVYSGQENDNYIISWKSTVGEQYQIQSSSDLSTWQNIGNPISGTGVRLHWANPIETNTFFYRVKIK